MDILIAILTIFIGLILLGLAVLALLTPVFIIYIMMTLIETRALVASIEHTQSKLCKIFEDADIRG